jgi:hypothetical protein
MDMAKLTTCKTVEMTGDSSQKAKTELAQNKLRQLNNAAYRETDNGGK